MSSLNLDKFLNNEHDHVVNTAVELDRIAQLFEQGNLTEEQYKELVADLVEVDKIGDMMDDLTNNARIQLALRAMFNIAQGLLTK